MHDKPAGLDILLITPPSSTFKNLPVPLGVAYLASYLLDHKVHLEFLDLSVKRMDLQTLVTRVQSKKPSFVGFTCCSVHLPYIKDATRMLKQACPNVKIVIGGPHPTALPKETLEELEHCDIAVVGEGELTLLEIVTNKELPAILGIAYRDGGSVRVNAPRPYIDNLDTLPFPARHLLPLNDYQLSFTWEAREPAATMITSRGCPNDCIYCASKVMWRRRVRFRSAENVLSEIAYLVNRYGVKEILIYDDTFLLKRDRLEKICQGLIQAKYDLTWCCLGRVDGIDLDLARLMKRAGCHMISFGVESGSQEILDALNKRVRVSQITKAFEICRTVGINTKASFMFGSPGETFDTVEETIALVRRIVPDYVFFFLVTPFPGTALWAMHERSDLLCNVAWDTFDQTTYGHFYNTDLSKEDLRRIVKKAYIAHYLNPRFLVSLAQNMSPERIRAYISLLRDFAPAIEYVIRGKVGKR